jgi:predicted transcriptional regulator
MAEALTRNGSIRYQGNYLGRLVQDYLGRAGSLLLTTIVMLHCTLALFALYFGFLLTLAGATPVRPEVWAVVLFLLGCAVVRGNSLHATVTSALVVGAITLSLILLLSGLALPHLRLEHLLYIHVPFLNGQPFEPALLGLVFGVVFTAYFGHFSVSSCASTVLRRDPTGRSLSLGCIAAQASAIVLYILWVVAVNGAIAPQGLAGFSGTALTPLAQLVGPVATIGGAILVILAMGMASMHISMTLFLTVRERLPGSSRYTVVLGRRQGRLLFTPHGKVMSHLTLTYLGLKETQPQLRLELQWEGKIRRFEIEGDTTWEARAFLAELPPSFPSSGIHLRLHIIRATAETVRVQCTTPMRMTYEANWDTLGLNFLDMIDFEPTEMDFVSWLAGRKHATLEEVTHFLQTQQNPQEVVNRLVERGFVSEYRENRQTVYRVHFAARRRRQVPSALWQTLDPAEQTIVQEREAAQRVKRRMWLSQVKALLQGEGARSWLALSPLFLIFLLVEWLLGNKLGSFSQLINLRGVITVPVVAGVFPILLLLASRRKGEKIPAFVLPFLAHPIVAGGIYLVAVSTLFLHGLLIWQDPFQRGMALLVGSIILAITALLMRQGAFACRLVIEVRQDTTQEGTGIFTVTDSGRAATEARVQLDYADEERLYQAASGAIPEFAALCSAKFQIPSTKAKELAVWLHRVTVEGQSENLPALLRVSSGKDMREFHMDGASKQFVLPLGNGGKNASGGRAGEFGQLEIEVQLAEHTTHKN